MTSDESARPGFHRIDENVYEDDKGTVYEQRGGKMVPTGAKVDAPTQETSLVTEGFAPASELLVRPELSIEQAKKLWDTYKEFREYILKDDECADAMPGGGREMNRTGATRLAMPFGLSMTEARSEETRGLTLPPEIAEADRKYFPEGDVRYKKVTSVSKGKRHVQNEGTCRLSEIELRTKKGEIVSLSRREHDASSRAWTRSVKRGIADILGGTEA